MRQIGPDLDQLSARLDRLLMVSAEPRSADFWNLVLEGARRTAASVFALCFMAGSNEKGAPKDACGKAC